MQAAWLTFATHGRRELPGLTVVFAMLAGGAPLQSERLAARGGPAIDLQDPLTFYDTSSYGAGMIDAMAELGGTRAAGLRVGSPRRRAGPHRPRTPPDAERRSRDGRGGSRGMSLSLRELERFATALADAPERWRHLVRHADDMRVYEQIWDDEDVNAWLICWSEDQDTGFHDHDESAAGIAVVSGQVREDRLTLSGPPVSREIGPGTTFTLPPVAIHRVLHAGTGPAVTIHCLLAAPAAHGRLPHRRRRDARARVPELRGRAQRRARRGLTRPAAPHGPAHPQAPGRIG